MQRDEIRLECIKLAATRSPDHTDVIKRAEQYFGFVMEPEKAPQTNLVNDTHKKSFGQSGNAKAPK